jgi:hypothetical protein
MADSLSQRDSEPAPVHSLGVRRPFDNANDAVSLGEEGYPIIQHAFLLIVQVLPLGTDVLGLCRRLGEGPRGILAREDCGLESVNRPRRRYTTRHGRQFDCDSSGRARLSGDLPLHPSGEPATFRG